LLLDPDQIDARYQATLKAQRIRERLGDFQVEVSLPVVTELANWVYASQYAGIIFKAVLATLFFLSFLLVNNFITLLVDDKMGSLAVLRLSGSTQQTLSFYLALQSLRLLLPAVLLGLSISAPMQIVQTHLSFPTFKILSNALSDRFRHQYQLS
jgi:hypothetical protein